MKYQPALNFLVPIIVLLALVAALGGLFLPGGPGAFQFTTLRGETTAIYGEGLYAYDTLMAAGGFKGTDVVTIVVVLPLLLLSFRAYRRGSLGGSLILAGALSFFLYNGASMSFAVAYNNFFFIYAALFSASLFSFILVLSSIDPERINAGEKMPRKRMAAYFILAGAVVLVLWGMEIVAALLNGEPPVNLASYTTSVTHAIDMGIIAPSAFLVAVFLLQSKNNAYRFGLPITVLNILIGLCVIMQTVMQTRLGVVFSAGQMIGIIGSWVFLAGLAGWTTASMYRNISDAPSTTRLN